MKKYQSHSVSLPKLLLLFSSSYAVVLCLCSLMCYRFIQVGPFVISGAMFLIPFAFALNDLICEVYGYYTSRRVIWAGLFAMFIFSAASALISITPMPTKYLVVDRAFNKVFAHVVRSNFAIIFSLAVGAFLNTTLLSRWKVLVTGRFFLFRSVGSSVLGEFIFSVIVNIIILAGIVSWGALVELTIASYSVKILFTLLASGPNALLTTWVKRVTKFDVYDRKAPFNPFKSSAASQAPPNALD